MGQDQVLICDRNPERADEFAQTVDAMGFQTRRWDEPAHPSDKGDSHSPW